MNKQNIQALRNIKRKPVSLSQQEFIKTDFFGFSKNNFLIVKPAIDNIDLTEWSEKNQEFINKSLLKYGAILFRGFNISTAPEFESFGLTICSELFNENGEHPRENISGNVYTPVFYPPEKQLLWHNENSFNHHWPMKLLFCCLQPAVQGGETTIVDSRKVFERLLPKTKEKFIQHNVMYIRNYGDGLGLNWETVFQTQKSLELEEICRQEKIQLEWKSDNRLKTFFIRPAVVKHPQTGEITWFNQALHWHPACLDTQTRESLTSLFGQENLPRNCYYGDGTAIEESVMQEICKIYRELEVNVSWEIGDVLLLDNLLTAHGRNPFVGERKLLVAMGGMTSFDEI